MSNSGTPKPNSAQFTADPLLKPGTFIDPTTTGSTTVDRPESRGPPPKSAAENADSTPRPGSGRRRPSEPMDWLPQGWKMESKERTTGASAGTFDKYYYELATGRRFRSKKEVMSYLQTGDVRNKRKKENSEGSENKKRTSIENFDFSNAPEDVTWFLKDDSTETWTAVLDVKEVPESTRQEWAEAKDHVFASGSQNFI